MESDRIADFILIGGFLTVVILRICNVIHTSWWIIFSPLLIMGGFIIFCVIVLTLYAIFYKIKKRYMK